MTKTNLIHLIPELFPFSTCSEDTEISQDSSSTTPPSKTGDIRALEFGGDVDIQAGSTPDKKEGTHTSLRVSDSVEVTQKQLRFEITEHDAHIWSLTARERQCVP